MRKGGPGDAGQNNGLRRVVPSESGDAPLHQVACPRRALSSLIIALCLAGCQTTAPKTQALATANIPVVASCVDDASIDPLPPTAMPPRTAGPDALAAGAAADLLRYRELARRQQDMLRACAKVK